MKSLTLAFCVFKVFPYGGISRDLLRIARACVERGHRVRIYTLSWALNGATADQPGWEIVIADVRAFTNHGSYARFARWVQAHLAAHPVDVVVGMNKMPGLDVYYAGDSCFEDKARTQRSGLYRLTGRYRLFAAFERAVFGHESNTEILTISDVQTPLFRKYYGTQDERLHALPPGIDRSRRATAGSAAIGAALRQELGIDVGTLLVLFIGSGFIKKGLDRAIEGFAALPGVVRDRARLVAVGEDNARPFRAQARRLGIADSITILPGREDIPRFLFAADALVLPAYDENAGMVILEAMIAGVPVLATENCGYAHYVDQVGGGLLVRMPYAQQSFNDKLLELLTSPQRDQWRSNGLALGEREEIYQLVDRAVDLIEKFASGTHRRPAPCPASSAGASG